MVHHPRMNETITTTSGQTYPILSKGMVRDIEAFMVKLNNGRSALVYRYKCGLVKKITRGM